MLNLTMLDHTTLNLAVEHAEDVVIIRCTGRIVRGEALTALRNTVMAHGHTRVIVLDLSQAALLDAGGLSVLLSLQEWTLSRGIQLKLVNPSPFVRKILVITGLDRVFEISSLRQALELLRYPVVHDGMCRVHAPAC
jgi:anti-anti-sigma factor